MLIAPMRTLEQKISDAGPADQRGDPLILSRARKKLQQSGVVAVEQRGGQPLVSALVNAGAKVEGASCSGQTNS